ncbi:MAG: RDD family protein [Bacteroidia bacterium]|nr:RDD family protein [Bacteroidia bacterium]
MKNIEITTSQNVTIQYNLASPVERTLSFLLDATLLTVFYFLSQLLLTIFFPSVVDLLLYVFVLPIIILYSLVLELWNNGQSIGKKVLKIRVIRLDGENVRFLDYMMRWIFRTLDIYGSLGGVAILSVISSQYGQRLGDLLANTVVVNIGKSDRLTLDKLLQLHETRDHKITYPQVIKIPEDAMLIVKETLSKWARQDNDAHEEAFNLLVKKMEIALQVKSGKDKEQFLRTLLKDYIILTR